ncbi:hypothetical protein BJ742DRAFT_858360 [Cladochytrium replicatum]|nr:hypothetical protein BJ742DRAFT_858360 [Cladochytrium replicatum]
MADSLLSLASRRSLPGVVGDSSDASPSGLSTCTQQCGNTPNPVVSFRFSLSQFSKLGGSAKHYSPVFGSSSGRLWRILVHPRGEQVNDRELDLNQYVAVFLEAVRMPVEGPGWSRGTCFTLSMAKGVRHPPFARSAPMFQWFHDGALNWGFKRFIKIADLLNSDKLDSDVLFVCADISEPAELSPTRRHTFDSVITSPFSSVSDSPTPIPQSAESPFATPLAHVSSVGNPESTHTLGYSPDLRKLINDPTFADVRFVVSYTTCPRNNGSGVPTVATVVNSEPTGRKTIRQSATATAAGGCFTLLHQRRSKNPRSSRYNSTSSLSPPLLPDTPPPASNISPSPESDSPPSPVPETPSYTSTSSSSSSQRHQSSDPPPTTTTIYAHRVFLAARSSYFSAMFSSGMRESTLPVSTISVSDFDASTLWLMLDYLYTGKLADLPTDDWTDAFRIADTYVLDDMKAQAAALVRSRIGVGNCVEVYEFALKECERRDGVKKEGRGGGDKVMTELAEAAFRYICMNLKSVMSENERFKEKLKNGDDPELVMRILLSVGR